jgi:transposase-like protein
MGASSDGGFPRLCATRCGHDWRDDLSSEGAYQVRADVTCAYKRQAVDLVAASGRSVGSVAKELALRDSVLRRWVE